MKRAGTAPGRAEWAARQEFGAAPLIRLMVWVVCHLGRPVSRLLLVPICGFYFLFAPKPRAASLAWLTRALGRPPGIADRWRHFWYFAACLLDRVLLLNGRADLFRITVHGEDAVVAIQHGGFLFGAHFGSFEAIRAAARRLPEIRTSLVMYRDNARKTNAVLDAINPALAIEIIALGEPGSMLAVRDRLDDGHFVGLLADRDPDSGRLLRLPFLGAPAGFPIGPFRMACLLRRPVMLMAGIYRGGNRYDIHFERLDCDEPEATMARYVAALERLCRDSPYNWFNFFDFWA